jgi:hypothetical protein
MNATFYLRTDDTNKPFSRIMKITTEVLFYINRMNNFDSANFIFSLIFSTKMGDTVTKNLYGHIWEIAEK